VCKKLAFVSTNSFHGSKYIYAYVKRKGKSKNEEEGEAFYNLLRF
jgi:hypothetical protein